MDGSFGLWPAHFDESLEVGTISLKKINRPASSALEADYMINLMVCAIVSTGPFMILLMGLVEFDTTLKCSPNYSYWSLSHN